jgi:anti-sigma factor ChrR (cupin superfamily)
MLRCEDVTRLCASEALATASWGTRLAVRLHLLMCDSCTRHQRELAAIGAAARRLAVSDPPEPAALERILRRVLTLRSE